MRYKVAVRRQVFLSQVITVEADSVADARVKAQRVACTHPDNWVQSSGTTFTDKVEEVPE